MEETEITLNNSSRNSAEQIAKELIENPNLLSLAVQQALNGTQPQSWRVARSLEIAISVQPEILEQIEPLIIGQLPKLPEQTLRSFLKIYKTNSNQISENAADILLQLCFTLLENPAVAIAVRAYSCQILERLAYKFPEIIPELKYFLAFLAEQGNSSISRVARKSIKNISKHKR